MTDQMDRLRDHIAHLVAEERNWHGDDYADPAIFSAHEVPGEGSIYLSEFHIPETIWRAAREPRFALRGFAEGLADHQELLRRVLDPGWFAWVFRCEAWMLETPMEAPKEIQDARTKIANNREIHKQPDRIEVRTFGAASVDGSILWSAVRKDNREIMNCEVKRPGDPYYDKLREPHIPSALLRACKVTKWVTRDS